MTEMSSPHAHRPRRVPFAEAPMLDLVYLVGVVALFAAVALIAKGVERL
jgi:hypothetical protein